VCDRAEYCNALRQCPEDIYRVAGIVCRWPPPGLLCDSPERCTGSSPACPPDGLYPPDHVCRPAVHVDCDFDEYCSGSSPDCPANATVGAGTTCEDGDVCTSGETCDGLGACTNGTWICG
jgi:hypothetical protein